MLIRRSSENMGSGPFGDGHGPAFHQQSTGIDSGMPDIDPSRLSQFGIRPRGHTNFGGQFNFQAPASRQSGIVGKRASQVHEQYGQITPPDDSESIGNAGSTESNAAQDQQEQDDIAKANRAQRARNAANKRHSKTKKRKDSTQTGEESGEDDSQTKTTSMQREKNRVAAAKCRAKKKATSEEMQDVHREGSRANSSLHREVRELRDQKAFLRNSLLQHEPGLCGCHAIHCYNLAQAQQLAMGVGGFIPQPLSPSQESMSSIQTPTSETSGGQFAMPGPPVQARRPSVQSQSQNFVHGLPNAGVSPEQMQMMNGGAQDFAQMQQFNDFMQSSPDGNANFSA